MASDSSKRCTVDLESHVVATMVALSGNTLGGSCENAYRALVEIAEFMRQYHQWPVHAVIGVVDKLLNAPMMVPGPESAQ